MTDKSPAFQFYVNDWLSSPKITLMSAAEEGAYIRLLCYCWADDDCSLPDDDDQLIELSRIYKGGHDLVITNDRSLVISKVKACFSPHPEKPGFLTNLRLLKERQKQASWRAKSAKGGKKGSANRWKNKGKIRVVKPIDDSSSSSSSSSSDINKKNKEEMIKKSLNDLTVDSIEPWLSEKRAVGKYLNIDEHELLEKFKDYCLSTGKVYKDYTAAFRNAFKWREAPQIAQKNKGTRNGRNGKQSVDEQTDQLLDDIRSGKYS